MNHLQYKWLTGDFNSLFIKLVNLKNMMNNFVLLLSDLSDHEDRQVN